MTLTLEEAVIRIIWDGKDRCGVGFGKYPLGTREALRILVPDVIDSPRIREALKAFDERLAR